MNSHDDVKVFMEAADQTEIGWGDQSRLYMKLIAEEYSELLDAYQERDIVEVADACADLKWVIEGLEHTLNIPQQEVWDEVSRSNLQKIMPDGKVHKREDGKVMKPEGWTPPNIKAIFEE
jgi:predicted HAD superfamily Cof-like phosphohydrolase